jgi:hypothetical protein
MEIMNELYFEKPQFLNWDEIKDIKEIKSINIRSFVDRYIANMKISPYSIDQLFKMIFSLYNLGLPKIK